MEVCYEDSEGNKITIVEGTLPRECIKVFGRREQLSTMPWNGIRIYSNASKPKYMRTVYDMWEGSDYQPHHRRKLRKTIMSAAQSNLNLRDLISNLEAFLDLE